MESKDSTPLQGTKDIWARKVRLFPLRTGDSAPAAGHEKPRLERGLVDEIGLSVGVALQE